MYYIFLKLFLENKDALIALPTEVKTIFLISLAIFIGMGIARKAMKLLSIAAVVAVLYFGCSFLGVI